MDISETRSTIAVPYFKLYNLCLQIFDLKLADKVYDTLKKDNLYIKKNRLTYRYYWLTKKGKQFVLNSKFTTPPKSILDWKDKNRLASRPCINILS